MMHLSGLISASSPYGPLQTAGNRSVESDCWILVLARWSLCLFAAVAPNAVAQEPIQNESLPARLSAIEVSQDGCWIIAAGADEGSICMIEIATGAVRRIAIEGKGVASVTMLADENSVLLAVTDPPGLVGLKPHQSSAEPLFQIPLPSLPCRTAVSSNGVACVTMTWEHAVAVANVDESGEPHASGPRIVSLSFPPGQVLAVSQDRFLIADAFGGRIALLDLDSDQIVKERELPIHHIGGLCVDDSGDIVHLSHQRLSGIAETSRDDVHWGTLMQNNVSRLSLNTFIDSAISNARLLKTRRLGTVGNGASDPAGLAMTSDQELCIAISGTDQLAILRNGTTQPELLDVGCRPTDVRTIDDQRVIVLNRLSNTLSIVRVTNSAKLEATIGQPGKFDTPESRGERAFYSASLSHDQWMSCSSCHVDGHSPDLLADTFGDGRHESPKRIPSLFGVHQTGPWSWTGSKKTLEDQVQQTLSTTMHGDAHRIEKLGTPEEITRDLMAFMATLRHPPKSQAMMPDVEKRSGVFEQRGCIKCHSPDGSWTTPATWNVGVEDEQGNREFNPPSLQSVVHRRAFFHDARFKDLDTLIQHHHPGHDQPPNDDELKMLKEYLQSL